MTQLSNHYIDSIYQHIGEFSKYQLFVWLLVSTVGMSVSIFGFSFSFYAAIPAHRCKLPSYPNDTYEITDAYHQELVDKYIPSSNASVRGQYESCQMKVYNNTDEAESANANYTLIKCKEWVFSKQYFESTIVSDVILVAYRPQWNLVCDQKYKQKMFLTLTFIGTYSTIFFGIFSDKFGRKNTLYTLLIGTVILNIGISVLFNTGTDHLDIRLIIFGVLRFLCGVAGNIYNLSVVLAVEICGPSKRLMASNSSNYFFVAGEFLVVLLAYFIRDYKLLYCVYTSIIACMALYFWYVPESPRWLMVNDKKDRAFKVFAKIAKSNKRSLDELDELKTLNPNSNGKQIEEPAHNHYSIMKTAKVLVTNKKTLIQTLVFSLNWLTNSMIYNGLSFSTSDLFGDPYMNFTVSATVELIGTLIGQMAYDRFGRKIPYAMSLTGTGLALLSFLIIPKGYLMNIMAMVGKLLISFTYVGIYVIIVESYPTIIRNSALSINSFISRFGSVIAPTILLLGEVYWYPLPYIIFGALSCICATLFFLTIPETKGAHMSDTIEEYIQDNDQD